MDIRIGDQQVSPPLRGGGGSAQAASTAYHFSEISCDLFPLKSFYSILFTVVVKLNMPQSNPSNINVVLGTGAIIVVTVVAAAAIAVYESPEVRQFAEDCRRRIAIALHSLGDEINPRSRTEPQQPRYNRPEDAEGFLQSSAEAGVDADEDSRRRQREELMYWNQMRLEKMKKDNKQSGGKNRSRGSSFDDFLREDPTAEKGTFIYNTSADVHGESEEGILRRRKQGVRGLDRSAAFANPFADENGIEMDEQRATDKSLISPEHSDLSEDLYGASDDGRTTRDSSKTVSHEQEQQLIDISEPTCASALPELVAEPVSYPAIQELPTNSYHADAYLTGQDNESAFASIHAWADTSEHASFYSPLPTTPAAPMSVVSEPEEIDGQVTPTDTASLAGSGEDVGREDASSVDDVMSEEGDGVHTPGSWTEVGSVISESDGGYRA